MLSRVHLDIAAFVLALVPVQSLPFQRSVEMIDIATGTSIAKGMRMRMVVEL